MNKKIKVYFACSIRGEQGGKEEKTLIVKAIKELGHEVISEIFVEQTVDKNELSYLSMEQIYLRDMIWIEQADVIVADVSRVSMGVGFEVGWKLRSGGKVIALCHIDRKDNLTTMLSGCVHPNFFIYYWKKAAEVKKLLKKELGVSYG